jgi:hypothetical protein
MGSADVIARPPNRIAQPAIRKCVTYVSGTNCYPCVRSGQGCVWCGRRDLNPHSPCGKTDFLTRLRLSPPLHLRRVWGLDYPFTVPGFGSGVRCCPSSLYTFPAVSGRAWLGIAMLQGSPNLSSSTSPVSRRALKFHLSPLRLPISPRPHGFKLARMND